MATKYNKSEIMRSAHRFYKSNARMGRTFGECLRMAWEWAKDEIKFKEECEAKIRLLLASQKPVRRTTSNETNITWNDCYNVNSRGYMGAQYCGD